MLWPFLWYYKYLVRKKYPSARSYMKFEVIPDVTIIRTYCIATYETGQTTPAFYISSFHKREISAWREIAQIIHNETLNG